MQKLFLELRKANMLTFYPHQKEALDNSKNENRVAYYHDMGLGKTFTGAEKLIQLNGKVNLIVCQKSKIDDWLEHFNTYYDVRTYNLTKPKQFSEFHGLAIGDRFTIVGVINYDLIFRRKEFSKIKFDTLMLDESSLIQNETSKRAKFILNKITFKNVILLSGTPTHGKYENLWSQIQLLGWDISKDLFWKHYVDFEWDMKSGFPVKVIKGYKNVERLKYKLRQYGAQFLKTEEVMNLPEMIEQQIKIPATKEYRKFKKDAIIEINNQLLVGDTTLTKILYERQLCGHYNSDKLSAFRDILESTEDRLIVFYNFNAELELLQKIASELKRPCGAVNGHEKNLEPYEKYDDSITFVQYQAGAMGLNLQKANKIIYFTLPLGKGSCGLWEQSKKRIHRIGQSQPCFYYYLLCQNSIEERNLKMLKLGKELTDDLFEE